MACVHMINYIMLSKLDKRGYDDNTWTKKLDERDLMNYLYDLIVTLEGKLLFAELGSDIEQRRTEFVLPQEPLQIS